jgi:hypothetical protein
MGLKLCLSSLLLALAVGCGGAQNPGTLDVKTSGNVISSLEGHKTYAYETTVPPPSGDSQWAGAQQTIEQIKEHIDADMKAKGYTLSMKPEIVIRISLGVHQVKEEPHGSAAINGAPPQVDTVTDLAIDFFDYSNGGHLFHGTAASPLHHRQPSENQLAKAVRLILEPLPPASG